MSRRPLTYARIGGAGLAAAVVAALCTVPTAAGAADATEADARPDLLAAGYAGALTLLPGDDSPAQTLATDLGTTYDAAVDPATKDVYVGTGSSIVRVAPDGATDTLIDGLQLAYGVDMVPSGDVAVADFYGNRVVEIDPESGDTNIRTLDFTPVGLAVGADGTTYVADYFANAIQVFEPDGTSSRFEVPVPTGIAVAEDGDLVVASQTPGGAVFRMNPDGSEQVELDPEQDFNSFGVEVDAEDNVYAVDQRQVGRLLMFPADGSESTVIATGQEYTLGVTLAEPRAPSATHQEIAFTSTAPTDVVVDGPTYTPTATGGASGNPVTFSTTTPDVCSYDDESGKVAFDAAGTCTVAADQAGGTVDDVTYADADQATQDIEVTKGAQEITFTSTAPTDPRVGDTFTPTATGGASGNDVTFGVDDDSAEVCTITAGVVTFTAQGTCTITADQAGDENYEAALTAELPVAVDLNPSTLDLQVTGDTLTATVTTDGADPTGDVTFTVDGEPVASSNLVDLPDSDGVAIATLDPDSVDLPSDQRVVIGASYDGDDTVGGSTDTYTRTPPTLRTTTVSDGPLNAAGWFRTPVTIEFTCEAGSAAIVGDCPTTFRRANTGARFRLDRTITATDGGTAHIDRPLRVDTRGPVLDIRRVGEAPYARTARPIRCTARDLRSGVDGRCSITYGGVIRGPGGSARRVWTATATDIAGNPTTRTNSFAVTGKAPTRSQAAPSSPR